MTRKQNRFRRAKILKELDRVKEVKSTKQEQVLGGRVTNDDVALIRTTMK